mgnify:CR=1 FL=1|tara:strand:- start:172 stop:1107 length:936 start_codon:yes stop_codon:yes gene_type:complete
MTEVLVTGAHGFIGKSVVAHLRSEGIAVRSAVRAGGNGADVLAIGGIGPATQWTEALAGVSYVMHLAARVHTPSGDEALFHKVNALGTMRLARAAAEAGVKRFVYMSSVKVHGDASGSSALREDDLFLPQDAYGLSKCGAELALHEIAAATGMEVTVVRPPLVYGPRVKGNLDRLMGLVSSGVPLPFVGLRNRRSFVSVDHLSVLLALCLDHPAAANQAFLAADATSLSTPELLTFLAEGLGVPLRQFSLPVSVLRLAARVLGRQDEALRLMGSLEVSAGKARTMLGWQPATSSEEGIINMARMYAAQKRG